MSSSISLSSSAPGLNIVRNKIGIGCSYEFFTLNFSIWSLILFLCQEHFLFFTQKYLRRYGYLKPATKALPHWRASWDQQLTSSMEGDQEIEQAIRKLQRVVGLPVTGKITDEEAVKITNQMRCGMNDFHTGKRTKRFTLEGSTWNSKVRNAT